MERCEVSACLLNMDCFGEHQSFLKGSFNIRVPSLSLLIVIYLRHNDVFLLPWLFYCPYFIALHRHVFEHWYAGEVDAPVIK